MRAPLPLVGHSRGIRRLCRCRLRAHCRFPRRARLACLTPTGHGFAPARLWRRGKGRRRPQTRGAYEYRKQRGTRGEELRPRRFMPYVCAQRGDNIQTDRTLHVCASFWTRPRHSRLCRECVGTRQAFDPTGIDILRCLVIRGFLTNRSWPRRCFEHSV